MSRPSKARSMLFDPSGRCQAVMSRRPYNTQPDVNWAIKDWPGLEPPPRTFYGLRLLTSEVSTPQSSHRKTDRHMGKAQTAGNITLDVKRSLLPHGNQICVQVCRLLYGEILLLSPYSTSVIYHKRDRKLRRIYNKHNFLAIHISFGFGVHFFCT